MTFLNEVILSVRNMGDSGVRLGMAAMTSAVSYNKLIGTDKKCSQPTGIHEACPICLLLPFYILTLGLMFLIEAAW